MKNQHYDVIELRRYRCKAGARAQFSRGVDSGFADALEQLGAISFGHFVERAQADSVTWLRGYRNLAARQAVNQALGDDAVWSAHQAQLDALTIDSADVLLLRPLHADSAPPALAAVDPLMEPHGAQGIGVAHIVKLAPHARARASAATEACFAGYHGRGVTELGVLATLAAPDHVARQPIRSDGHYLVWLGMLRDEAALAGLRAQCVAAGESLASAGLLDGAAELLVLDPGARSRLRWIGAQTLRCAATLELAA